MVASKSRSDPPTKANGRVEHWLTPRTQLSSPLARVVMFTPLPPTIYEDSILEPSRPLPSTSSIAHPTPVYPSTTTADRTKLQLLSRKLRREKRRLLLQSVQLPSPRALGNASVLPRSDKKDFQSVAQNFKRLKIKEVDQRDDDTKPTACAEQPLQENIARARAA